MGTLTDAQHEAFAQFVAAGLSQTEAAKRAGFPENSAHNTGCRLAKRPEIQHRIDELLEVQKNIDTPKLQWIIAQAIEIERAAIAAQDYGAANRALELLARLGGHLTERRETYTERRISIEKLDAEGLGELLKRSMNTLPEAERATIVDADPEVATLLIQAVKQTNGVYGMPPPE
jgi:phage terminase small subunit